MRTLAVLSMHTSPLAQPGRGDSGGMNVYVRQLSTALARSGLDCDVYTRAYSADLPAVVSVEPGLRVHHVVTGPLAEVPKETLPEAVPEFTEAVRSRMARGPEPDVIHANYWLSGMVGHALKHQLDVPLVSTFHTLGRIKGEADKDPDRRAEAEAQVMSCSDAILASSPVEVADITSAYGVDPARIHVVPPGVEHAFFSPGRRAQARRAVDLAEGGPMLLFVGRIQPLKGVDLAVGALAALQGFPEAFLVVVGGPSGAEGEAELRRIREQVEGLGLVDRVRFVAPQPHEMLSTYYRAADVCIVPSRSESFGLVALEASACGTPVVAASVGGLRSLIAHARTGYLVESRDPALFAARAEEILGDATLAEEMSAAAGARGRRYSWARAAASLPRLCTTLADRPLVKR